MKNVMFFVLVLLLGLFAIGCDSLVPGETIDPVVVTLTEWNQDGNSWELSKGNYAGDNCWVYLAPGNYNEEAFMDCMGWDYINPEDCPGCCELNCCEGLIDPEDCVSETCESLGCCCGLIDPSECPACDSCCEECPDCNCLTCEEMNCCCGLIDPEDCPDCNCPDPETCDSLNCCEGLICPECCPTPEYETGDLTAHFTIENVGTEPIEDYEITVEIRTADLNNQTLEVFTETFAVDLEAETTVETYRVFDVDNNLVVWVSVK